ncbi:TolC family protein [Granulosicoccus antarcticus]|uniref:Outer membrane protein TolC n=1 Tax=Granulosicoccus antarcticus IMCC3135 TaxID=1192854 RepID=A0A2Z2P2L4_9GAMM|nr:TolC family protein [Granulosicoccus antarcticus]ASJ76568.1 hypothetical protein IMCC3135_32615 [Granulosicoccus antarcticus IMCC3135]
MNPYQIIIVLSCLALPLSVSHAETLEEAWGVALSSDQSLQAMKSQTQAAAASVSAAKARRLPTVNVDAAFTQLDDTPGLDLSALGLTLPDAVSHDNFLAASAQLNLPLYTGGQISNGISAANAALEANRDQEVAAVQNLKLAVADAFVLVLRATHAVEVANANVDSLQGHATDVENFFNKGLVPQNDLLAVQVSLANAQQKALQTANGLDIAKAAYNRQLGRALEAEVSLDEVMPQVDPLARVDELDQLTTTALDNRSELSALLNKSSALSLQGKAERGSTLPTVGLNATYRYLENETLDDQNLASVALGVSWALYDGGLAKHRASALEQQAQSARDLNADLDSGIRLQVRSAWLSINEARRRMDVAQKAVAQAEQNLKVAKDRYQNGIGTNTEVLDAEALRSVSQLNNNDARYDAALARLKLARSLGVL